MINIQISTILCILFELINLIKNYEYIFKKLFKSSENFSFYENKQYYNIHLHINVAHYIIINNKHIFSVQLQRHNLETQYFD